MYQDAKISIIVPAYNVQNYITQCLDSLIHQTYRNLEIIVVNDGSKDDTLNIINEYAKNDNRIIIINQENQGLSESRNNAMNIATGEYIMFVDADDWVETNMCEICMSELKNEGADLVLFSYIREYEDNSILKSQFTSNRIVFQQKEVKNLLERRIFGPYEAEELAYPEKLDSLSTAWGKLYQFETIKKYRFKSFKEIGATCEDVFFNAEALGNVHKAVFIDEHFYHYRKYNANSLTKTVEKKIFDKWKKAYRGLDKIIHENQFDETYKVALNNRFSINLIGIGLRIVNGADNIKIKYKMIKDIVQDELYKNAINSLDIASMPLHWKMFFWNAKHRITFIVFVLLLMMSKLTSKK
ncbi:MAG: glycosyltransferase [Clostridia bacterium]|nr:glycosyltransferase [Clostridia bacterium]